MLKRLQDRVEIEGGVRKKKRKRNKLGEQLKKLGEQLKKRRPKKLKKRRPKKMNRIQRKRGGPKNPLLYINVGRNSHVLLDELQYLLIPVDLQYL